MSKEAMKLALGELQAGYVGNAMQILREALAKPDFWEGYVPEPDKRQQALDKKAENARELGLDYEPAQQEQWDAIPDAFNEWWNADYDDTGNPYRKDSPAYWAWSGWKAASKQPEQEPMAHTTGHCENHKQKGGCQLHNLQCGWPDCDLKPITTPAQRTWVGLTDEEAMQICVDCGCLSEDWLTLLDAIEAKLKEKNNE